MRRTVKHRSLFALFVALVLVAAACGSDDDTTTSESSTDDSADAAFRADVSATVEAVLAGTWGTPPAEGPPLVEGVRIMHLSCGELLPSCSEPSAFMQEVGAVMGWEVDLRDLNFNIALAGDFIAEAIAGGYDAVTMEAVDCAYIQPALIDAKAAGMPVVSFYAHDCTTPSVGTESLMTETPQSDPWVGQWSQDERWAASKADWLIEQLDGDVRVITMKQEDLFTPRHIGIGFDARINECGTCEIVDTIEYTFAELSDGTFAQKVAQALVANTDANAIHFLYDGLFLVGGQQALADAGRDDLVVVGGEFTTINGQLLEAGVEDLIMFYDHKWTAYGTLDTVNRILNGEEPVTEGQGWQAVDADHPSEVDADGRFRSPVDYESAYALIWGIS